MDEIIKIALQSKGFKEESIPGLLTVAEATGNKEVAVSYILGIYEQPDIPPFSNYRNQAEFLSYDPFKDWVKFAYERQLTKGEHFHKDTDPKSITIDNMDELKIDSSDKDSIYRNIPTGKVKRATDYCSLKTWKDHAVVLSDF